MSLSVGRSSYRSHVAMKKVKRKSDSWHIDNAIFSKNTHKVIVKMA